MARYQIIYTKLFPMTTWRGSREEAISFAWLMRRQGCTVSVWEHTSSGSKEVKLFK